MAVFPIPYLYKNPAFWGDNRDQFYGTDFVNLPYQDKNVDNEKAATLGRMKAYIDYIKEKEEQLMTHLGIVFTKGTKTFSLADSSKMNEINGQLKEALEKIQKQKNTIQNTDITQYYNTKIQQVTSTTAVKTVSKIVLKNLLNGKGNPERIDISSFLAQTLNPIQSMLQKNPKAKQSSQWEYFLETQTKLLSYIIDFFHSPEIKPFSNSAWYVQYYKTVLELEKELKKHNIKRDTRNLVATNSSQSKFTILEQSTGLQVEVNIKPLQDSVTASLQAFTRKDFPKMVEEILAKGLGGEHTGSKGFSGGKVYHFSISLPEVETSQAFTEFDQLQQQLVQKKTEELLQLSLKGRRTVKTDISLKIGTENFGISVKTGQQKNTKLDTRSNYFTFINFISQYSPSIAQALQQPQNQHILVNMVANNGSFQSPELNQVLNMIAYAFFGAKGDPYINAQTEYFDAIGEQYNENVLIVNEDGVCTRVSTYLEEIYLNLMDKKKTSYSLKTSFIGQPKDSFEGPPPPHPHPAESQLYKGVDYLRDIAVETYIKTFH